MLWSLKQSTFFSGASTIRLLLHGSGLIFEKTKLCTDPSFVYTGTAEPWKFLTLSEEGQNWWPNGSTCTRALVNRASFCTVCAVKAWSLVMRLGKWRKSICRFAPFIIFTERAQYKSEVLLLLFADSPRKLFLKVFAILFDKLFVVILWLISIISLKWCHCNLHTK